MSLSLNAIYQACNPSQTLDIRKQADRLFYTDLAAIRGGDVIQELESSISLFSPHAPTCQLLAGQVGCGKSVELRRLQDLLATNGFQAVYVEASRLLDMTDVDAVDVVLMVACEVARSVSAWQFPIDTPYLELLLERAESAILPHDRQRPSSLPIISQSRLHQQLARCVSRMREHSLLRSQLRQFFDPQLASLLDLINQELIVPVITQLQAQGWLGLVILVDNFDRLTSQPKTWGRNQPEYIFIDRGDWLRRFQCHVVYTLPLSLLFSKEVGSLQARFDSDPLVLPLIPLQRRDRSLNEASVQQLRQLVLQRVFPHDDPDRREAQVTQFCESSAILDRLCVASGGHLRHLLRLLHRWMEKDRQLPLTQAGFHDTIGERRQQLRLSLSADDRTLLAKLQDQGNLNATVIPQDLLRSALVLEYRDLDGSWFTLNPILSQAVA